MMQDKEAIRRLVHPTPEQVEKLKAELDRRFVVPEEDELVYGVTGGEFAEEES